MTNRPVIFPSTWCIMHLERYNCRHGQGRRNMEKYYPSLRTIPCTYGILHCCQFMQERMSPPKAGKESRSCTKILVLVLLSGVRINIDGSEVVWRSQPRAHSSILRYVLDAGYSEVRRWTRTLPQRWWSCQRRSRGEIPVNPHVHIHIIAISSRGDYSRTASISFRACLGAATI